jgi:putative flippase GtrA
MFKEKSVQIISYLWSLRIFFLKYFVVGITSLFLDLLFLAFFKEIVGLDAVRAVMLGQLLVICYNFLLNKYWSFSAKNTDFLRTQLIKYLILIFINYIIGIATMFIFNKLFGFDYLLVRTITVAVAVMWNFFLYKYWVYR